MQIVVMEEERGLLLPWRVMKGLPVGGGHLALKSGWDLAGQRGQEREVLLWTQRGQRLSLGWTGEHVASVTGTVEEVGLGV